MGNRIEAKNGLENYCLSLKSSISGDENQNKLSESDKSMLESKIDDTMKWLDNNQNAETEDFEEKQKSLSEVAMPILQKMGGSAAAGSGFPGGGPMPDMSGFAAGGMPGGGAAPSSADPAGGPAIEEID